MISVAGLWIYPVKGARGLRVDEAEVGDRGFVGDRRFVVVEPDGRFLTQRELPRMALLSTALDGDTLTLGAPGQPPLALPRRPTEGAPRQVTVWNDTCAGIAIAPAAEWLTRFLGQPVELVYMPDASLRPVDPAYGEGMVSFADGFPFLLCSVASLDEVNQRGAGGVPMDRFRPNVIVHGAPAFAEDRWTRVQIGEIGFRVVKPCPRCAVTTVDQATAEVGVEPLATLATFRRVENKVNFGQNLIHEGRGRLRVGDRVEPR